MDSLIFALNATLPIVFTVALGYFLKRIGLIGSELARGMNKLVFRIFIPAMIFLNIYKIESFDKIDLSYVLYGVGVVFAIWLIMIPICLFTLKDKSQVGVMLQAAFRSNFTLIGVPLAESLFGTEGVIIASLLSAFVVTLFNILAVISLTAFSGGKPDIKKTLLGIVKNPLIQGIALGLMCIAVRTLFVSKGIDFRVSDMVPVYKVMTYLSNAATPLALIVLGAQFELSAVPTLKKQIVSGVVLRNAIVPAIGLGLAYFLGIFGGAHFAAFMGVFATPIAVSTVPMAQEMGGDTALAGQLVVWTTVGSAFTIFFGSFILKALGIF